MMSKPPRKSREKTFSRTSALLVGLILSGTTVAIAARTVNWSSVSEAQLLFAGGVPQPPLFQVKTQGGQHFFHVTSRPVFKNVGFKSGAVQRVDVEPVGLQQPPRELKMLHFDKREIGWLETKEIRCEFVAVMDSAALDRQSRLEFKVHFYGPDDREIYWEGITIENIDARSSLNHRPSRGYVVI